MQVSTGRIFNDEDIKEMNEEVRANDLLPLPADIKVDTIRKLQKPNLGATKRRQALKALNRSKNKEAKKARRLNRKR